jgi:hypothetical protein
MSFIKIKRGGGGLYDITKVYQFNFSKEEVLFIVRDY